MAMKGQSSIELTLVVGLALVLSSPFIFASQSSMIELRDASRFLDLDQSLDKVRSASLDLNQSSYPARRVVKFKTPEGVTNVYNPNFSDGSGLIFEVEARGNDANRSILLDMDLDLIDEGDVMEEGIHEVSLRRADSKVNMSVIS